MVALFPLNLLEDHSCISQGSPCLSWYACKQQTYTIFDCSCLGPTNNPFGFPILSSFFERKARLYQVAVGLYWIQARLLSFNLRHSSVVHFRLRLCLSSDPSTSCFILVTNTDEAVCLHIQRGWISFSYWDHLGNCHFTYKLDCKGLDWPYYLFHNLYSWQWTHSHQVV